MLKLRLVKLGFAVVFLPGYLRWAVILPFGPPFGLPFVVGDSFAHPFVATAMAVFPEENDVAIRYSTNRCLRQGFPGVAGSSKGIT